MSDLIAEPIDGYNTVRARIRAQLATSFTRAGVGRSSRQFDGGNSLDPFLSHLARYRFDAIVSTLAALSPEAAAALAKLRDSVIAFDTKVSNAWMTAGSINNACAGAEVADHFPTRVARSRACVPTSRSRQLRSGVVRSGY